MIVRGSESARVVDAVSGEVVSTIMNSARINSDQNCECSE